MRQFVLRPLGLIALTIFVFLLPVSLAFRELATLVFDAEATKAMVREHLVSGQMASALAQQLTRQIFLSEDGQDTLTGAFVRNTLSELSEDDWRAITALTIPANLVDDTVDDVVNGYTDWLDGDAALPEIRVELEGWKTNIQQNAGPVLGVVLEALPECSGSQVAGMVLGALQSFETLLGQISGCRPPEPVYSALIDNAGTIFEVSLSQAPSSVDVGALGQLAGAPEELAQLKDGLVQLRRAFLWGWLAIAGLGVLAGLMAGRDLKQALVWIGVPFLLAGLLTFVFGLALEIFSLQFVDAFFAGPLLRGGGAAAALGGAVAGGALDFVSGPLMMQGLILIALGAVAAYAGYSLSRSLASPGIPINRKRIGW